MDTIYSRRKIRIPKLNRNDEKNRKLIKILAILIIASITLLLIFNLINPTFEAGCKEKVKEIATLITNTESSRILKQKNYGNIVELVKDDKRKC